MAIDAGTLLISIEANTARIKADMDATKAVISSAMKDVEQYVGYAAKAFVLLGGVTSIGALQGIVTGGIEAKVKLYDLSVQTGITVEALSGLGKIAKYSNTELGDVAGASNKLSKALFTQNEDSKGAAQALKALGLNFTEFKGLSADQQFVAVAKAMGEFEDGTQKSAAAMLLYGKTGALLLPFLKELEERGYAVGKQTTDSAIQAKRYEDNLITLKAAADAWKRTLAEAVLPTMISISGAFVDARKEADSFNVTGAAIKTIFETVSVLGVNVAFVFGGIGRELGAIGAQAMAVARGDFAGAAAIRDMVIEDGKRARADLDTTEQKLLGIKSKIGTAADFQRGDKDTSPVKRKTLGLDGALDAGATKDLADGYDSLMKKLSEKIQLDQTELDLGRKLTESEKLQIDAYTEVEKNFGKLTVAKMLNIDAAVQLALAIGKERDAFEANLKWMKEATDANATYVESQMQLRDQLRLQANDAQLQLKEYGLTADELKALESARLRDAAAALEQKAALADSAYLEDNARLYREQASALRDTAAARDALAAKEAKDRNDPYAGADRAVKEYLADVKRAGDATYGAVANSMKGLEDLTVTALTGGDARSAAKAWVNGILNEVVRLQVVKPMLASIFGGTTGGGGGGGSRWGSLFGSIVGLFTGGGSSYSANGGLGYATAAGISGGRAGGGSVDAGKNYLVGEKGPEILRMGNQSGSVVPNDKLGGRSTQIDNSIGTLNVGQGVSRGEMAAALQQSNAAVEARIRRLLRNGNI